MCIVDEISLCTTQDFRTLLELRELGCALWLIGDPSHQLTAIGDAWHGTDLTGDISETAMLRSAVDCKRCVFTEPKRCDVVLFNWLSSLQEYPLSEAIALARRAFPRRGRPQETNLCLCHLTRRRVIARAQKEKLRRERPRDYLSLDGEAPLGQGTLYWPGTRHIACMAQSKQGIHNSMLLECVSYDREHVTLRNVEEDGEFVCTHSFCKANLRSALCFTISSAQGRTIPGTIGLYDLRHARYSIRHLYTCLSRARGFDKLSCED